LVGCCWVGTMVTLHSGVFCKINVLGGNTNTINLYRSITVARKTHVVVGVPFVVVGFVGWLLLGWYYGYFTLGGFLQNIHTRSLAHTFFFFLLRSRHHPSLSLSYLLIFLLFSAAPTAFLLGGWWVGARVYGACCWLFSSDVVFQNVLY